MERLYLRNNDNSVFSVRLIRYFEYDESHYLIYTLDETDQKGYLKLYLLEVLEELGEVVCYNINDDDYWKSMENIVKAVIKEIKAGTRDLLKDLSPLELNNVKVVEPRYFKLDKKLADILSSNYLVTEMEEVPIDDKEIEDLVIEPVDLPKDEIIELESKEDNMTDENMIVEPQVEVPVEQTLEPQIEVPVEQTLEPQVEVPVEQTLEPQIEVPVEQTLESQVEIPVEQALEPQIEVPVEQTLESQVEVPVEQTLEPQVEVSVEQALEPQVEVPVEQSLEPQVEVPVEQTLESQVEVPNIDNQILENTATNASGDVNYKELYFAIKEEKEATEKVIEELIIKLNKYKEKYGELE